jgi:4-hydroxy-tetrahydrodipicolinate synthase
MHSETGDPVADGRRPVTGIIPVMLTPFREDGAVDYDGLDRLTDWYLANGADALFAVCQSSEMQALTMDEKAAIARRVVSRVDGRIPVVASGHTSNGAETQRDELLAVAETGVDALILVTSRLDPEEEGEATYHRRLDWLLSRLPDGMPLGLYECPWPYRRLLTDAEILAAARSGRFVILKDVSCDLGTVTRRLELAAGTPLAIVNANAAIAFDAIKAGSQGFCGVFNNFHPDLYAWLYHHAAEDPELATDLAAFLSLSAMAENLGYPGIAKIFHQRLGTFPSTKCRLMDYDPLERFWALGPILDTIGSAGERFRQRIKNSPSHPGARA